jgi:outer membrane protein assembly factor BamB
MYGAAYRPGMNRRLAVPAVVLLLAAALFVGQAATAPAPASPAPAGGEGAYPGDTLVAVQVYGWFTEDNGNVFILNGNGTRTWEYDPPHAWVFDAEMLDNGNVQVAFGQNPLAENVRCPDRFYRGERPAGKNGCIYNRVVEVNPDTNEVVWEHSWYDAFPTHHEVHDADRLPSGETVIIDMGNDRTFTVDRSGEVTWQWNATEHLTPGTPFWEEHVAPLPESEREEFRRSGPESDWTHMNDVDLLENGNFQMSIRNFDTTIEVDRETGDIVDVIGAPTRHEVMNEQHNPNRLERHGTLLVADSENDRVVEVDAETGDIVWRYDGTGTGQKLAWPRDADRLPNGNTLITDSRNFRLVEVGPNGSVVWSYSLAESRGIIYEADRLGLPEEPDDVPAGGELQSRSSGGLAGTIASVESWLGFVFPQWVGIPELGTALVGLVAGLALLVEGYRDGLFARLLGRAGG